MSETSSVTGPSNSPADEPDNIQNVKVTFMTKIMQNGSMSFTLTPYQKQNFLCAIDRLRELYHLTESEVGAQLERNLLAGLLLSPEMLCPEAINLAFRNEALGVAAMEKLNYADAAKYFTKSICAFPTNALVFVNRAISYSRLNRYEDAIADCNIALAMDPNCCEAHHTLGNIYYSLWQLEDSLVEFEEAVRLNPSSNQYRYDLKAARDRYSDYLSRAFNCVTDDSDTPRPKRRKLEDPPLDKMNVMNSTLPSPSTRRDCMSAATKRYKCLRRMFMFDQMDFEFAFWQMLCLFIAPQKVFRNFRYRKQTKLQFARDDLQGELGSNDIVLSAFTSWSKWYN